MSVLLTNISAPPRCHYSHGLELEVEKMTKDLQDLLWQNKEWKKKMKAQGEVFTERLDRPFVL